MSFTDEDRQKMDTAATDAQMELADGDISEDALRVVANWWKKWYLSAGHKRLARILLEYAGQ